ncbi:hypothetical protein MZM54_02925 [[Brevibacterium] frigoritolerans]|nr:hypothetical protein [Peribacillus frigoritolerans]
MNIEINLGKYVKMPSTIEQLLQLEENLEKEDCSLGDLDLFIEPERFAYDVTPYDVITFASTGMDGIHFGLLTDFGMVSDLENAFVVCISPMDFGDHIKIVARNITEFIGLVCTMKGATPISNFILFQEEASYVDYLKELKQQEDDEYTEKANYVISKVRSTINCELFEDVYDYVERKVKTERKNQIILPTLDGIGIIPLENKNLPHTFFKLERDMELNLNEVRSFFNHSTSESKLAFIRDAQFTFLMPDEQELKELVINELLKLGLTDDAERLKNPY